MYRQLTSRVVQLFQDNDDETYCFNPFMQSIKGVELLKMERSSLDFDSK
jgi:hypothetical protein